MKNLIKNLISLSITVVFIVLSVVFIYANNNLDVNINEKLWADFFNNNTNNNTISAEKNIYSINNSMSTVPISANETTTSNVIITPEVIRKNNIPNIVNENSNSQLSPTTAPIVETTETTKIETKIETVAEVETKTNYFSNSLFIGDSRTEGLRMYCNQDGATYFSVKSLDTYKVFETAINVENLGLYYLDVLLVTKKFDKVYICLGVNNIGSDMEDHALSYKNLIDKILVAQPSAKIYIQSNIHVTKSKSESSDYITNKRIDAFNDLIKNFENNSNIFYIDLNEVYDNENHTLIDEYTNDGVHLKPRYYNLWINALINNIR